MTVGPPIGTGEERPMRKTIVVGRQINRLVTRSQKLDRREMKRVECADRNGKGIERACQNRRSEFDQRDASQQGSHFLAMGPTETTRMYAGPHLVFQQPARHERVLPKRVRRRTVFREDVGQGDGRIEIDQRASRSSRSSASISSKGAIGRRGGTPLAASGGGVIHPCRTASASRASPGAALRPEAGGTSSATTRLRSVTRTVSPAAAARTYSLS